ncbi:MAG: hypothetical protein RL653_3385 [Pseudomonadota bacterium]|jgi:hypothetical protein
MALPPCGLYRTTVPLGTSLPAGRLVYFHNHGEPSAGVYLPASWNLNRAQWSEHGTPIPDEAWAHTLAPLPPEGLYRVRAAFPCCDKRCRTFDEGLLVQLGYTGLAEPLLFVPEWAESGLGIPGRGSPVDLQKLSQLEPLKVPQGSTPPPKPAGNLLH